MKQNGHLTFQCVIDYWGVCSDAKLLYGMPGTILSFKLLYILHQQATYVLSSITSPSKCM